MRGIKQLDGYASQPWTVGPEYAVKLDPRLNETSVLLEPASVVAKAWDQIEKVGNRSWFEPRRRLASGVADRDCREACSRRPGDGAF